MTAHATNGGPRLELLASTANLAGHSRNTASQGGRPGHTRHRGSSGGVDPFVETAQWTADGTVVLTSSSDNQIAGYIVPEDLLAPKVSPLELSPSCRIQLPERSNVLASAPYFDLAEPYTHQVLVSSRDHPIQLYYLQPNVVRSNDPRGGRKLSTASSNEDEQVEDGGHSKAGPDGSTTTTTTTSHAYPAASSLPFIKPRSETFETATALIWPGSGQHFIAGTRNMLAKFDVSRSGSEAIMHIKTVPSGNRNSSQAGAAGAGSIIGTLRGTISTLSAQPSPGHSQQDGTGLIAAGTWTRWVGLYDFASSGRCVATWGVASAAALTQMQTAVTSSASSDSHSSTGGRLTTDKSSGGVGGAGITQTIWSPCGRYLLVNERRSRGILVYDVRVTGRLLGWLSGRDALGNQRISCDVYPGQDGAGGFEVWSGTTHGAVKVWEAVGSREGEHAPAWDWQAHHGAAVGSACLHQSGSVVATASGSWGFEDINGSTGPFPVSPTSGSGSSSSSNSSSSESENEEWLCRRVKESSLKLWGIAGFSLDHGGTEDRACV
ncbi:uncharacterized protein B0I36DRAFT_318573 [Microdochium trichocladiopsis]|uniref:WD40-repeat-containing domain protein n=1 Tax=Microdochium trichocladiopsis TaxID=1682393 RepID=A0A9P8YEL0_9PEZI|nr:uncharacterized protein B0I36DRAFT_318573 [Microdochium trichocladiopsis]KAH7035547.1 hypothetical protein B0I36DRAFT_318573 [Microdochium trichocladiopsis]